MIPDQETSSQFEKDLQFPGKTKAQLFAEDPDRFIDSHEILLAITRKDDRYGVMNNCKSFQQIFMAAGFAEESCQLARDQIRYLQMQQTQGGIIRPDGHGIPRNGNHNTKGAFGR